MGSHMDEDDDKRDRAEHKRRSVPPGWFSRLVAWNHIMDTCGVSQQEAKGLLGQACAEGRIRVDYTNVAFPSMTLPGGSVLPPRVERRVAGYYARDVWREFPPKDQADDEMNASATKPKRQRGYQNHDRQLVDEMHQALKDGSVATPWEASLLVVGKARGRGSEDSKRKRLLSRYVQTFHSFQD
jgi:hypothetical protein